MDPLELGVLILVILVAGPLTWDHYYVWALLPLVLVLDLERWQELMDRLGGDLETDVRRANLVIDALDLFDSRGKTLRIGTTRLLIHGEVLPCERMDEALPGLQAAMRERWGGGAFAEVIAGGDIAVGDTVEFVIRDQ